MANDINRLIDMLYERIEDAKSPALKPEQVHYDIADWAIAGNRLPDVAESLWFYNPFGPQCRSRFPSDVGYWQTRIGDHCFYNPTDAYYKT